MSAVRRIRVAPAVRVAFACALSLALAVPAFAAPVRIAAADDEFETAPPLAISPVADSLGITDARDIFTVDLAEDEVLELALSGPAGVDFDLSLYSPGVSVDATRSEFYLVGRSAAESTAEESVSFLVPPGGAGTYSVEVQAFAGASGAYTLDWQVGASAGQAVRLSGADRYKTAVAVSRSSFATATTAVVASGANWPDALSAAGLAGAVEGPVLLAPPTITVDDSRLAAVTSELERLGVHHVYVIGGEAAVSADVYDALAARVVTVERVSGASRYETAAKVAQEIEDVLGSAPDSAFVVRGDAYADALAVSPFAYSQRLPVLLTKPASLDAQASAFLEANDVLDVVIAGGQAAVAESVLAAVDGLNGGATVVERASGDDRYETAADVAESGVFRGWGDFAMTGIATGQNFPDALAGGAAIGSRGGVLLLTRGDELSAPVDNALNLFAADAALVFGGDAAVAESVRLDVEALLQ